MDAKERKIFEQWIIENIDETVVPADEGNGDALAYNIIQVLYYGKKAVMYNYQPQQDEELKAMGRKRD